MRSLVLTRPRLALIAAVLLSSLLIACDTATPTAVPVATATTAPPTPAPGGNTSTDTTPTTAPATGSSGPVAVTLQEYSITPNVIEVAAGHQTFTVTNGGKLPHNFVITVNGQPKGTPIIPGGQS